MKVVTIVMLFSGYFCSSVHVVRMAAEPIQQDISDDIRHVADDIFVVVFSSERTFKKEETWNVTNKYTALLLVGILNQKQVLNENQLVVVDVTLCGTISFVLVIELPRQVQYARL